MEHQRSNRGIILATVLGVLVGVLLVVLIVVTDSFDHGGEHESLGPPLVAAGSQGA